MNRVSTTVKYLVFLSAALAMTANWTTVCGSLPAH